MHSFVKQHDLQQSLTRLRSELAKEVCARTALQADVDELRRRSSEWEGARTTMQNAIATLDQRAVVSTDQLSTALVN